MLVFLFATNVWHLLPGVTRVRPGEAPWSDPKGLVLPIITLVLVVVPYVSRVMRVSTVEVLESDYVEMARLKGLPERTVLWRHAIPNAMLPTVTVVALTFGYVLGGAIGVEEVFAWPGMGSLIVDSIKDKDFPVLQGVFLIIAACVVLANLIADVLYGVLDPRVRT